MQWTNPTVWSILRIKPGYLLPELAHNLDQAIGAVQICPEPLFNFLSHDLTIYGVYSEYLDVKV